MIYIKLFERQDYSLSNRIKEIYDEFYSQLYAEGIEYRRQDRLFKISLYSTSLECEVWLLLKTQIVNPSFSQIVFSDGDNVLAITFTCNLLIGEEEDNLEKVKDLMIRRKSEFFHEIQHLYDYVIYGKKYKQYSTSKVKNDKGIKAYYNTTKEINAYFIQHVTNFINTEYGISYRALKTFKDFKDEIFDLQFRTFYNNLTLRNRKVIDKRLYQVYLDLLDKYSYRYKRNNVSIVGSEQTVYLPSKEEIKGVVVKKALYRLNPLKESNSNILDYKYTEYDKNGNQKENYIYDLLKPEQLPPIIIDEDNNVIFDYHNIYNIAKANGLKIVNCIVKY